MRALLLAPPALLFAASALVGQSRSAPSAIEQGRRLYVATGCYQCHGFVGQGGKVTGPALLPRLLPLEAFAAQLRSPIGEMPPYTDKVMSDAEVTAIHAYLASLPAPPAVTTIPLLREDTK